MASQKRKGVGAGVTALMGTAAPRIATPAPEIQESRIPELPGSRENGKPAVRKLTVDVPESVHDDYEDLYFELRRTHRRLKRVQYAPLVIRFGLDRQKIEQALSV